MNDLASIDWQNCLELSNNKADLAYDLLKSFVNNLNTVSDEIQQYCSQDDQTNLNITVHKLYGTSCYVGVPRLRTIMRAFEQATKQNRKAEYLVLLKLMHQEVKSVTEVFNRDFSEAPRA